MLSLPFRNKTLAVAVKNYDRYQIFLVLPNFACSRYFDRDCGISHFFTKTDNLFILRGGINYLKFNFLLL